MPEGPLTVAFTKQIGCIWPFRTWFSAVKPTLLCELSEVLQYDYMVGNEAISLNIFLGFKSAPVLAL